MMKKLLAFMALALPVAFAGVAEEVSYTIGFKASGSDGSNDLTASNFGNQITEGAQYVEFKSCSKVYSGKEGLKFSSAKVNGTLTLDMTADAQVVPLKIVVTVLGWENSKGELDASAAVAVNGLGSQSVTAATAQEFTFTPTSGDPLKTLTVDATGRIYLKDISVYYDNTGEKKAAGLSFPETAFDIAVGTEFTAPVLENPNNLAVSYTSSDEAVATVDADGKVTVKGTGTTRITATSAATDEFRAGEASYTLNVLKSASTVAALYGLETGEKALVSFPLTVTYKMNSYCYAIADNGEVTLIYGVTPDSYVPGSVIPAGWSAEYSPYNGLPEVKPVSGMPEPDGTKAFKPETVKLADITAADVNRIVIIEGVTFAGKTLPDTSANFEGTSGDATLQFRNTFRIDAVEAGTYDVKAAIAIYSKDGDDTIQAYPISYDVNTGVAAVGVAGGDAAWYTVDGRAVSADRLDSGLYIKVADGKAVKVMIRR